MRYLLILAIAFSSLFAENPSDLANNHFGFPLNTQNVEYNPIISPNGRYIVFQSNRPGGQGGMDFWLSENRNYRDRTGKANWMEPVNLNELSTMGFDGPFTIQFDEEGRPKEIYFTSIRSEATGKDGYKGLNIYYTHREASIDKWSVPIHLNDLNSDFDDKMPTISPDGRYLVFSSNRPGGFGEFDLWISERVNKSEDPNPKWSRPINIGNKVNSAANEIMPYFHYDNLTLYFSSDRNDEYHKFNFFGIDMDEQFEKETISDKSSPGSIPKKAIVWKEVYKLPKPFNSSMDDEGISLTHDGIWVYYASNRDGGEGQFDIYRAKVPEEMRKPYLFDLSGIVIDGSEETMIGIASTIKISTNKGVVGIVTSERIGGDISKNNPKNFSTKLYTNYLYKLEVSAPDYYPTEFTLDLRGSVGMKKSKYVKIVLMPIKKEEPVEVPTQAKDTPREPTKDVKDTPANTDKPAKEEKKSEGLTVILRDFKTKKEILNGSVQIYTEAEKNGIQLKKEKEKFILPEIPANGFELHGKAPGYQDETIIIKEGDDTPANMTIEIFLRMTKDVDKIYNTILYYELNESKLTKENIKLLDKIAAFLKLNVQDSIEIGGHTDNIASKEFNVKLSDKRAEIVKEYLVSKGIDEKRIKIKAYWYSQPQAGNDTEDGRAKNRRVNFKKLN
ncbi:MAG TPA: OmpA family protein [Leptospiraceae bacterium]|nr:OmpA family protein [Leptospiraceae bacterium]HMW05103.1 OmpA family protein [Leptospiraceae bacterium]HMX31357.1 OmpA family protein [Leptospiraceae bacterium]HMY31600.1 OmpA family protein [Leptospiraceae bacterium]HMZ66122.1 OmpA family protein [Leptospiraceae bacterium]